MFISLMIVIIVLNEVLTLIYAKPRLEYMDISTIAKIVNVKIEDKYNAIMLRVLFRFLLSIFVILFYIYALIFIPYLFMPVLLDILLSTISVIILTMINKNNPNLESTFNKRLWLIRFDSVASIIIWLPYFLPLLALIL